MVFHYIIRSGVCYLVLCKTSFEKRSAFSYLEDLNSEFFVQYGNKIDSVTRPYAFIEFDNYIQKSKRSYCDPRNARNHQITQIGSELGNVRNIMVGNIEDVLKRGVALDQLSANSQDLKQYSDKYHKKSRKLNQSSMYVKVAAGGGIVMFFFFLLRFFFF